jgi:predicted DsbA family dithiol-disulfide isomerase
MSQPVRIDFISDVMCPWCAVGLYSLKQALAEIGDDAEVEVHFQPFELNPNMPAEGQNTAEHIRQKYGERANSGESRKVLVDMGARLGFPFNFTPEGMMWNTFDAHRLLYWAGRPEVEGGAKQQALKEAMLAAHFQRGEKMGDHAVLAAIAESVGLDGEAARAVLRTGEYGGHVRALQQQWAQSGIQAVPSVILNGRYLLQGGQPPEQFAAAIRQVAAMPPETASA